MDSSICIVEGQLRDEHGMPFEFQVYNNHGDNQKRYEDIGEVNLLTNCLMIRSGLSDKVCVLNSCNASVFLYVQFVILTSFKEDQMFLVKVSL